MRLAVFKTSFHTYIPFNCKAGWGGGWVVPTVMQWTVYCYSCPLLVAVKVIFPSVNIHPRISGSLALAEWKVSLCYVVYICCACLFKNLLLHTPSVNFLLIWRINSVKVNWSNTIRNTPLSIIIFMWILLLSDCLPEDDTKRKLFIHDSMLILRQLGNQTPFQGFRRSCRSTVYFVWQSARNPLLWNQQFHFKTKKGLNKSLWVGSNL